MILNTSDRSETGETDFIRSVRFRRHEFHNKNLAICSELHSHATFPHFPSCSVGSLQHKQTGSCFPSLLVIFKRKTRKKLRPGKLKAVASLCQRPSNLHHGGPVPGPAFLQDAPRIRVFARLENVYCYYCSIKPDSHGLSLKEKLH